MTTPIMDILDLVQHSHLNHEALEDFERNITALYNRQSKETRDVFFLNDFHHLMIRYTMNDDLVKMRIVFVISNLLIIAKGLGSRLPNGELRHYRRLNSKHPEDLLLHVIAEVYSDVKLDAASGEALGTGAVGKEGGEV